MNKIKYIIVDDEPIAHRIIEGYCNDLPHLELQEHCYDALQAMQFLNNHRVDLMFLDINMPKLKGFDFLKTLSYPPKVIVTTAYKEFALEGYELNVCDYLLKPFSFERFVKAVNKAVSTTQTASIAPAHKESTNTEKRRFFVKGDKKYHQVDLNDILFIEAFGNYAKLFLRDEMIITHEKISSYEELLPAGQFIRVHKSFMIAVDKINLVEGNRIIIQDHTIPIGQMYKLNVNKLFE
ncbi:LytTR family DNA-binding domain-containing protein [Fulvivirgaceae bacterium BMA10]|uniref:LytTR family DNA-binding domain-containing protein n=1 Tax=Splendidivirga corallicola TaxID=3051826 RepID=A0ABT8KKP6_9BACT|nr:LytTR family DNA-binding domain-containing protein [Fulvivirgaceae bacterium BMA10]